jgi:phospholipase C
MSIRSSRQGLKMGLQIRLPFNNTLGLDIDVNPNLYQPEKAFVIYHNTHLWLLFSAAHVLRNVDTCGDYLYQVIRPWNERIHDDFRDALCLGLYDADKLPPYNDAWFSLLPTWKSHFYDPDTGMNWLGETNPTAVSQGCSYYDEALQAYQQGDEWRAGYCLGLALHYLTDLTQPMHAANFTWMDSVNFGYHTDFERFVSHACADLPLPTRYAPHLPQAATEVFFTSVARYTKDAYYEAICKPEWTQSYDDTAGSMSVWQKRVGRYVKPMLYDAVQTTAQFLRMWANEVELCPARVTHVGGLKIMKPKGAK